MSERTRKTILSLIVVAWVATSCAPALDLLAGRAIRELSAPVAFPAKVH